MANPAEQFRMIVTTSKLRLHALIGAGMTAILLKEVPGIRGHLPEPFDVFNHLGNVNGSLAFGGVAGYIAGSILGETEHSRSDSESTLKRRTRATMIAAGVALGAVVNASVETKLGLSINPFFKESTPDMADFAYGVVAAGVGAVVGNTFEIRAVENHQMGATELAQEN